MGSASSSYRVIYLDVDGRIQKVVFSRFCSPCDIKELFCTALGVPRNTTLSLVDPTGALVSIDPTMPHNTERSPYRVVPLTGGQLADKEELFQNVLTQVAEQFSRAFKINELKTEVSNRLAMLEKRVERNWCQPKGSRPAGGVGVGEMFVQDVCGIHPAVVEISHSEPSDRPST